LFVQKINADHPSAKILSWPWFSWSYGSWICNWCLSPLMLWVRTPLIARCTTLCDKAC